MNILVRRRLHRFLGVATTGLVLATATACVSDATPSPSSTNVATDPNATVHIAWAGPPTNLDPQLQVSPADMPYTVLLYDRLTRMSADGNSVEPMLATSWTFSSDGKSLELKLRTDVTFHDGTPFNSAAVKANLERGKNLQGSTVSGDLASITSIDTPDASTVVLGLNGGGAALPVAFTTNTGEMISPKAIADGRDLRLGPGDAGSGAYTLTELKPGESANFQRSESYWDGRQRAKALEITVANSASAINGLIAGQFDLVQVTTGADTQRTLDGANQGQYIAYVADVRGSHTLMLNSTKAPLDNLKVRQAISLAIDRDSIGNQLYEGQCVPSYQPFGPGNPAYNPSVDADYKYNLDKAKQLLAESGVANPTVEIEYGPAHQVTAEAVQAQLVKAGINAQLKPVPQADVSPNFNGGESMATITGIVVGADASTFMSRYVIGGANWSRGGDPTLVDEVKTLSSEALNPALSTADRGAKYQQVQKIIADQAWAVQVCSAKQIWAHSAKVVGVDETFPGAWAGLPEFDRLAMAL